MSYVLYTTRSYNEYFPGMFCCDDNFSCSVIEKLRSKKEGQCATPIIKLQPCVTDLQTLSMCFFTVYITQYISKDNMYPTDCGHIMVTEILPLRSHVHTRIIIQYRIYMVVMQTTYVKCEKPHELIKSCYTMLQWSVTL